MAFKSDIVSYIVNLLQTEKNEVHIELTWEFFMQLNKIFKNFVFSLFSSKLSPSSSIHGKLHDYLMLQKNLSNWFW